MQSERWKRIDQLLDEALELEPDKRILFLEENCFGDQELKKEVEALLAFDEKAHDFIETPAYKGAEELLSTPLARLFESQLLSGGRYQIICSLGSGGMGEVYRAKDLRLGREVAIKVLPERMAKDAAASKRFEREATALAALSHQNILSIFDFGTDEETSYVVMELLQGETLRKRLENGPLKWREALEIAISIEEGLSAAHSKGVIHRDLKPENVFVTSEGVVKILDFGLALFDTLPPEELPAAPTVIPQSTSSLRMGTVGYMPPEQLRGERMDARSDLFSYGCILYEMLRGKRPFIGKDTAETIGSILKDEPAPISQTVKDVPHELDGIIQRCLKKNPKDRFQSARDVGFELKKLRDGPSAQVISRKIPRMIWAAAILILVFTAGLIATFRNESTVTNLENFSTSHPKTIAILPFRPLVAGNSNEVLELGMADTLITRLGNTRTLTVRPLSSVRNFVSPDQDPVKIGKALKVESILEGSLQRSKDRIRVNVRMVRVADGATMWTGTFDEKFTDIFVVQDTIAAKIVSALNFRPTSDELTRLEKRYTRSAEAYDYYILGRYHELKITEEGLRRAIGFYEQAIKADPKYALAYAHMGDASRILAIAGFARAKDVLPRAQVLARKALEIDGSLAEAYLILGWLNFIYEWDWASAETMFKRAIELSPNDFQSHLGYAFFLSNMDRHEEAVAEARRARELSPMTLIVLALESQILLDAGYEDEAVNRAKQALDFDPNFWVARLHLGAAYNRQKRYAEAIAELEKARTITPKSFTPLMWLIDVYADMGDNERLYAILNEMEQRSKETYVPFHSFAAVYNSLGQKDKALDLLEKSLQEHEAHLVGIRNGREWDNLRSDPRFVNILRTMNVQVSPSDN